MQVEIVDSMAAIDAGDWNRLAGDRYPFLRHEFLLAAETTGCVSKATGWVPRHLVIRGPRGDAVAAMPLYEKSHSWGEFVFDWAWAQAYERAGVRYYPKLVSAVPFTPAPSPRLLASGSDEHATALLAGAVTLAREAGHSSLHVLFPHPSELGALESAGLKLRKDCQFHWHNAGYHSFDDFLATFSSAKRKKARRDRRHVREQGIEFRWLRGDQTDAAIWSDVYEMISYTFLRRGSMPYYDYDFFVQVAERLPQNILVVLAEKRRMPVAAAVFYVGTHALYGRYWGSDAHYNALHFETCYYQGIDYCIANGLELFEPGTQGEHKVSRGFVPATTWSAHWLTRPEFFAAIGRYLKEERRHVERYMAAVDSHSPYRAGGQHAGRRADKRST
jgi:predicted N-acyltransferase